MGKVVENFRKYIKSYIITFFVALLVGVAIFLTFYFVQNQTMVGSINGTGVAFAALFGVGVFSWLGKAGAFDSLTYGFTQAYTSMFSKQANKYNDMVAYKDEKNVRRKNSPNLYYSFFLASLLYLISFIVLEIVKTQLYGV
jgi:hypothetical protein